MISIVHALCGSIIDRVAHAEVCADFAMVSSKVKFELLTVLNCDSFYGLITI